MLPLTRIHGTCQIVNKNGSELSEDVDFSTVNLFPLALFNQIDLEIDGVNLSGQDNLYPYKAYLETLLFYGHDAKFSHLTTSHFCKDSAGHFDDGLEGNRGYLSRKKDVIGSKLFDFCINPHIDFLHTTRVLPSGIPMKIKLTRSNDSFSIISKSNEDLCVKNQSLNLFVYRMQPSDSLRRLHGRMFLKKNALFPISRSVCKKYTIPYGLSSANQPNIIDGLLPRQLVIGFVKASALNGNYSLNPFNFHHFDCSFLAIRVNELQVPTKGYRPNFENRLVRRELRALYDNLGVNSPGDDSGCNLNVDDFVGCYALYCFDLTVDRCNGFHLQEDRTGTIYLEILFSKPLQEPTTVICYASFENVVALTNERKVILQ